MSKLKVERQQHNKRILEVVQSWVEAYPDLRFNQILSNLGITRNGKDLYHEESEETLKRVKTFIE